MTEKNKQNDKYLLVGTGRNGSSLLATILQQAGMDFGLPETTDWDKSSGALEHPLLHAAYKWHSRAEKIRDSVIPSVAGKSYCQNKRDQCLQKLFSQADIGKSSQAVWLAQPAQQCNSDVTIIGLYRNFSDYVISRYKKFGRSLKHWRDVWLAVNEQIILEKEAYGGAIVGFDELITFEKEGWADRLAAELSVQSSDILNARNELVAREIAQRSKREMFEDTQTQHMYQKLESRKSNNTSEQ